VRQINEATLALAKSFESCKLTAYQDQVGVWTIGWGHTGKDVYEGCTMTQEEADTTLLDDLQKTARGVEACVKVPISDNQFGALVSFAFNVGLGNLEKSTLLKLLNEGDFHGASLQFQMWDHAGGVTVPGLLRRRTAEVQLFLT